MRILGLDYGTKTVGVAMSDPDGFLASPLETIRRKDEIALKTTIRRICQIADEYYIHTVILGYPLNMDDSEGQAALKVKAFKKRLEKDMYRCRVILQDERLTTVEAEEPMILAGIRDRRKRKEKLDQMAACVILQEWLDNHQDEIKEMTND